MKQLAVFLKDYKKECIIGPAFKLLEACFELFIPLLVALIIDVGIKNNDIGYIINMCLILVALAVVGMICSFTAQYFAAKAAVGFSSKLRHALMKKIQSFGFKEIDSLTTATLITRMTSDVNQVQNGINLNLRLLLRSPFVVAGSVIMAFTISFQIGLIFLIVVPVLCLLVFGMMLLTMPKYKKVQSNLDEVTKSSRENLSGVRVLRAFCREDEEVTGFKNKTNNLYNTQVHVARFSALLNPLTFIVINLGIIFLIYNGAIEVDGGILTQGQVIALYNYMGQILVELIKTADFIVATTKAVACAKRIVTVLQTNPSQNKGNKKQTINGEVEFKNVSLKYYEDSDEALSNISFKAEKGQIIGVLGSTGSGKSSLVNLIPRFYDCTNGSVLIDGVDVKHLENITEQIAVVPQKAVLFKGSIKSNLEWGKENATEEEMQTALNTAQANSLAKDGTERTVDQGGRNFSGGEKQRLTIARALMKNSNILILDDSSSALDYATDANLRKSIANLPNRPTTFIVSQRASSVLNADLILVLDDGRLVGSNTHEKLLEVCEEYQKIYYAQFPQSN